MTIIGDLMLKHMKNQNKLILKEFKCKLDQKVFKDKKVNINKLKVCI